MRIAGFFAIVLAILALLIPGRTSADWGYPFVVHSGKVYILTDTVVASGQIGRSIGQVTRYSDREGTYSGNFSNAFPEGTRYYSIAGMEEQERIAVQSEEGRYLMAEYKGEYEESFSDKLWQSRDWLLAATVAIVLALVAGIWTQRRRIGRNQ